MRSIPIPTSKLNTPTTNTLAPTTSSTVVTTTTTTTITPSSSPWHSPIPYLFGGLAIIMAIIALALLMLACSYWRLTRTQHNDMEHSNVKEGDDDPQNKEHPKVYEENILVIMAGDQNPTFLATPSCPNSSSLVGKDSHKHLGNSEDSDKSQKETTDNHVVVPDDATQENGRSQHEQQNQ